MLWVRCAPSSPEVIDFMSWWLLKRGLTVWCTGHVFSIGGALALPRCHSSCTTPSALTLDLRSSIRCINDILFALEATELRFISKILNNKGMPQIKQMCTKPEMPTFILRAWAPLSRPKTHRK
ncbi:hypothetical protein NDU88_007072 [Pleurodeles waltl]|uniref:Uncharacterized protein n=1 Tax=Pleurodeles waltl TaxID=8319 RepID=A0AAV7TZD9_PLEWA|nr:hypothetical protein NDU88_007072 [Pleurodeles waltl]